MTVKNMRLTAGIDRQGVGVITLDEKMESYLAAGLVFSLHPEIVKGQSGPELVGLNLMPEPLVEREV